MGWKFDNKVYDRIETFERENDIAWKVVKRSDHIKDFHKGMKPHLKRFAVSLWTKRNGDWDFPHAYTNLFVEAARLSPYHSGHYFMVIVTVLILTIIGLAAL